MENFRFLSSRKITFSSLCLLLFLLFATESITQVPFSTVRKDVLKQYTGVTVTDRGGGKISVDESVFPNRRYYVAFVRADNKDKIEGRDVVFHRDLEVYYDIVGGKYVFNSASKFGFWLTGDLKPPTFEEAAAAINNNYTDIFSSVSLNRMTEFEGIKEIMKEKYSAFDGADNFYYSGESKEKKVWFKVKMVFTCLNGNYLEKREAVMEVDLMRDNLNSPWKTGGYGGMSNIPDGKVLESRELTDKEYKSLTCNTLKVKAEKEVAMKHFNSLPVVDIPQFKTAMEMTWWIHRYLMNAKPDEAEYVLMKLMQPWYFWECGSYMLTEDGYKTITQIKKMVSDKESNYGAQYCENPKIKEQSGTDQDYQVAYYQKTGNSFSRIRVGTFKGELKISNINLSWNNSDEFIAQLAKVPADFCKSGPMAFWKTYNLSDVAISASFPTEPQKSTDPDNSKRTILRCNFNGIEWLISGEPVKASEGVSIGGGLLGKVTKEATKTDVKDLSKDTRDKMDAGVDKEGTWQIRGARGYDAVWNVSKKGSQTGMRYRSVIYKDVFYQIWIIGKAEQEDVDKFFESVQINK